MEKQLNVVMQVAPKDENITGEMIEIMKLFIKEYVPAINKEIGVSIPSTNESMTIKHKILFGGDQLTVACARSAIKQVQNSDTDSEKILGLLPVVEDWHTKQMLLMVYQNKLLTTYITIITFIYFFKALHTIK